MLNKNYFIYLFKSKKHLFLITCILQAIISFSFVGKLDTHMSIYSPLLFNYVLGAATAFILPLFIFSYVHNKKAVDTYFSLNMSRNTMLFTGLVYCFMAAIAPYVLSLIITLINFIVSNMQASLINVLYLLLTACVTYLMVIVFNAFIYFLANSITDGFVILIAYYAIPLMILFAGEAFASSYLVGVNVLTDSLYKILIYLSPIALSVVEYTSITFGGYVYEYLVSSYVVTVVYIVLFTFLLFKSFNNRKVERAGNYSDGFFAYPFIISFYTIICLFIIASGRIINDFYGTVILYALLFAAYFIGNFVYKRKFSLSKLQVLLFVGGVILSLGFNYSCEKTNGFGLSRIYKFDYDKMTYDYYSGYVSDDNESEYYDFFKGLNDEDKSYMESGSFSLSVVTSTKNHELVDMMESYREYILDNYLKTDYYEYYHPFVITYNDGKDGITSNYGMDALKFEDFIKLAKDKDTNVTVWDYYGDSYTLIYDNDEFHLVSTELYSLYDNLGYDAGNAAIENSTKEDK